ncbi:MAG: GNAT family N-acetyltransferase [Verrucomicrobiota bacterium]
MTQLPTSPAFLSYEEVTIVFSGMTDGDDGRGFVPGYHFKILNADSKEVGHLNFRVGDTEHVRMAAGHIGFEVADQHRGNRYVFKACHAAAPWVSEVSGIVLISVDPDSVPSIRTIEKLGAAFLDEVDVPQGDPYFLKGSLRKRRYLWEPNLGH